VAGRTTCLGGRSSNGAPKGRNRSRASVRRACWRLRFDMQLELPDLREAIIAHDSFDKPAIIVMDGIGGCPYQELCARGFRHLLPGESMASSASDNIWPRNVSRRSSASRDPVSQAR
jgi:hypothetical protein